MLTRRLGISTGAEAPPETAPEPEQTPVDSGVAAAPEKTPDPPAVQTPARPAEKPRQAPEPRQQPEAKTPERTPSQPAVTTPTVTAPATQTPARTPPPAQPAETRNRSVYFTHVDSDGTIVRSPVTRTVAASDSPMRDSLSALLAGPTAEEQRRGIISLIPAHTRVLSSTVRGTTAYISFSEEFQYNTYGVEGYAAQLKQIVWTATEFPTVNDVQILIEGRRVDYLGEGIWIGSPVSRESL